jgi:DHA1 family multidrug resistance protein-like MFS transporter
MASFFVAGVITQYFLGHLADKFGRRPVLIVSLVAYGLASMTFLLPFAAPWFVLTRAIQGAAAGAIEVASMSAVAALFAQEQRGRAISRIFAAQLFGIALGPVVGVVASVHDLGWAFFATGVVSLVAAYVAFRTNVGDASYDHSPLPRLQWNPQVIGALFATSAGGLCVGVYEACWSLLMHAHHATTLEIRLSWTMFAIPWVALSHVGGWLADHANRRFIALAGIVNGAFFLSLYPHIHNNVAILFLGSLESVGASLSLPSISSLMSQGAVNRELSRRQGLYATSNTAALAAAAGVSGFLFSVNAALPFTLIAIIAVLLALTTLWWWRHVTGHVGENLS